MNIIGVKTRLFQPPKDNLDDLIESVPALQEEDIVVFSSKVVSICEGNTIAESEVEDKDALVEQLADAVLEPNNRGKSQLVLTLLHDQLVESAGVDHGNGNGYFLLLPPQPYKSARNLWEHLRQRHAVQRLGIIISDSRAIPAKQGAINFALSSYGFKPTKDFAPMDDLFGEKLQTTVSNVAESAAAAAGLVMGETNEKKPIAIVRDLSGVEFFTDPKPESAIKNYSHIDRSIDVYGPLLDADVWKRKDS